MSEDPTPSGNDNGDEHVENDRAGATTRSDWESSDRRLGRCMKYRKVCGAMCCLVVAAVVSLLVAYGVRLGSGDESHTYGVLGTCRDGVTDASTLKVLTMNTFLIDCLPGARCQGDAEREARVKELTAWFADRDEDVVLFQEVWSHHGLLRDGMTAAGYCNFVKTESDRGSGLAIFSKHPIVEHDFVDWFDAFGIGDGMAPDLGNFEAYLSDKGALYAKVTKDGRPVHFLTLHTNSDTTGDYHGVRVKQFNKVREFLNSKNIPSDELVVMGGDFNEDKDCRLRRCEGGAKCEGRAYYNEMVEILSVGAPEEFGNNTFTYDTEENDLLKGLYAGTDCDYYQYRLDYVFYSNNHLVPSKSACEVLTPLTSDGRDMSDHFPVICTLGGLDKDLQADVVSSKQEETNLTFGVARTDAPATP
ncbi:hypothetical protein ACHAWF_004300 [Thalassiosira exigua]